MPAVDKNKVKISVYMDFDSFRKMDDMRNPKMSRSEFCSVVITEALGITN